jgi:hypothetical protein
MHAQRRIHNFFTAVSAAQVCGNLLITSGSSNETVQNPRKERFVCLAGVEVRGGAGERLAAERPADGDLPPPAPRYRYRRQMSVMDSSSAPSSRFSSCFSLHHRQSLKFEVKVKAMVVFRS